MLLDAGVSFTGTIGRMVAGDKIDLAGVSNAQISAQDGQLTITEGASSFTIGVTGAPSGNDWLITQPDGHGGTMITATLPNYPAWHTLKATDTIVWAANSHINLTARQANAGALLTSLGQTHVTITGGGNIVLNSQDSGLIVDLSKAANLTLSAQSGMVAIGSAFADTITAMAAGQTLSGGAGADRLIGYSGGGDSFTGTAWGMRGDTIVNFVASDVIHVTNIDGNNLSLFEWHKTATGGALTIGDGSNITYVNVTGSFKLSDFTHTSDGAGGVVIGLA